jgi:hypothetical protein
MVWCFDDPYLIDRRTPLANLIRWKDKPVALSIVQARLVGLAHFSARFMMMMMMMITSSNLLDNFYG